MKKQNILTIDENVFLQKQQIKLTVKYKNKKLVRFKLKITSFVIKLCQKILGCKIKIEFDKDFIDD